MLGHFPFPMTNMQKSFPLIPDYNEDSETTRNQWIFLRKSSGLFSLSMPIPYELETSNKKVTNIFKILQEIIKKKKNYF